MDMNVHCVNCYLNLATTRRNVVSVQNNEVRRLIQTWITPLAVEPGSVVCDACLRLAIQTITEAPGTSRPGRQVGHQQVCVCCGQSVLRQRSHVLRNSSNCERHIMNVVAYRIQPRQLRSSDLICHPCWQRCNRATSPSTTPSPSPSPVPSQADSLNIPPHEEAPQMRSSVLLPNYGRA